MDHAGDEEAAPNSKRAKLAVTGSEDHLSALPDDVLIHILLKLRDTAFAARTSILSRRWRRVWTLLPEIHFSDATDPRRIRPALAANEAPAILHLAAVAQDASPYSVAAWLQTVAPRLSGDLIFRNIIHSSSTSEERGGFELPCFHNATSIRLSLGFLGLTMPASGVFAHLIDLCLDHVWIYSPDRLADVISSRRCPALQRLAIRDARCMGNVAIHSGSLRQMELRNLKGFNRLTIHSESLLKMELSDLRNHQLLTVTAPSLEELTLSSCILGGHGMSLLVSSISAPQLLVLKWKKNTWHPKYVELGEMTHLHCLDIDVFLQYGTDDFMDDTDFLMDDDIGFLMDDVIMYNTDTLMLLQRFKVIHKLNLRVDYLPCMRVNEYLMEDITRLPDITFLSIVITAHAHSFGACLFHVLRMCTGVRKLALDTPGHFDEACPSDCPCGQPPNWKSEELMLDCLQEAEISNLRGTEHELAFMERLFSWATVLKQMTVTFDESITESRDIKEFCQKLLSFSPPEVCMGFFVYRHSEKILYVPVD
ncbi:uncharacterized protein [Lolium perenne]|uniref:uncharacterized protein n=1 Tax=Lolium perenne TaxID=4522 RepID=UPI0021EA2126|nr:putative F-box/LRR-repeat protein At5g02930 [Lolium perenne]